MVKKRKVTINIEKEKDNGGEEDLDFIKVEEDTDAKKRSSAPASRSVSPRVRDASAAQRVIQIPKAAEHSEFMDNKIKTTKYTVWNFFFKNIILEQFRRIANLYFLVVALLTLVPGMSNVTPLSSFSPLAIVVGASAVREAVEDYRRSKSDKEVNNRECNIIDQEASAASGKEVLSTRLWMNLKVGDIVKLEKDQMVPADMVLISSALPQGLSFVETANLDGETNLKIFQAIEQTVDAATPERIGKFECTVYSEMPNNRLYVYEGSMKVGDGAAAREELALGAKQVLLRGCSLRNTPWVYGVVVNTGFDTKLMQNQTAAPLKRSSVEGAMNTSIILLFIFMFVTDSLSALFSQLEVDYSRWYLFGEDGDDQDNVPDFAHFAFRGNVLGFFFNLGSFIVLYSVMIPISLYVTLEMCKLVQTFFMAQDINMYYEKKDQPAMARTSNLTEELGQIEYIFSDKTGTLTQNEMIFNKCSVAGHSYDVNMESKVNREEEANAVADEEEEDFGTDGTVTALDQHDLSSDDEERNDEQLTGQKSVKKDRKSSSKYVSTKSDATDGGAAAASSDATAAASSTSLLPIKRKSTRSRLSRTSRPAGNEDVGDEKRGHVSDLPRSLMTKHLSAANSKRADALDAFWTLLAVAHTVIPEDQDEQGIPNSYQAESPDELALVLAAKEQDFLLVERSTNLVILLNHGVREEYRILNINDFNSTRKRMSVVVACPDGSIRLMVKGADNVIKARLSKQRTSKRLLQRTDAHLEHYSRAGLRTLLCAQRVLDPDVYAEWNSKYHAASIAAEDRAKLMDSVAEMIESDLDLLGATAIEDKLQDDVPRTLANLGRAGIRIWVLTGDKIETAINIARSANLIGRGQQVARVTGPKPEPLLAEVIDTLNITPEDFLSPASAASVSMRVGGAEAADASPSPRGRRRNNVDLALVLDGAALEVILGNRQLELQLLIIAHRVRSVVCCRVSPLQKSLVVKLVRENLGVRCLAIGDGANDVSMIQAAQVGIGISGNEGMQAVMASDYAIAQFKYLETLLLVHGRWNYKRVCRLVLYSFYKNFIYVLVQVWFNMFSAGFSAQNLYDPWLIAIYNLIPTALPIMFYCVFEQDVSRETVLTFPQLYESGLHSHELNALLVWSWIANAVYSSAIIFFGLRFAYDDNVGIWSLGTTAFTIVILVVSLKMALEYRHWTPITAIILLLSMLSWFAYGAIYGVLLGVTTPDNYFGVFSETVSQPTFWFCCVLLPAICLLPDLAFKYLSRNYFPENYQILQEVERSGKKFTKAEVEAIDAQLGDMAPIQEKFRSFFTELAPIRMATRGGKKVKRAVGKRVVGKDYDASTERGMLDALRILKLYKPQKTQPGLEQLDSKKKLYSRPSLRSVARKE